MDNKRKSILKTKIFLWKNDTFVAHLIVYMKKCHNSDRDQNKIYVVTGSQFIKSLNSQILKTRDIVLKNYK